MRSLKKFYYLELPPLPPPYTGGETAWLSTLPPTKGATLTKPSLCKGASLTNYPSSRARRSFTH